MASTASELIASGPAAQAPGGLHFRPAARRRDTCPHAVPGVFAVEFRMKIWSWDCGTHKAT